MSKEKSLSIKTVTGRHGKFSYYERDRYIGYGLGRYGEYSEAEVELLCSLVQSGSIVIEVGANIGSITVPLAKRVGENGAVYAIEAQPENYRLLARNIHDNGLKWVQSSCVACGDKTSEANIPALSELDDDNQNYGGVAVGVGTTAISIGLLDEILRDVSYVDLIKIDVEGMEAEVLRGASRILKCRPLLYVENDRTDKAAELMTLIRSSGYRTYDHRPPIFNNPANHRGETVAEADRNLASFNVLCVPEEKAHTLRPITDGLHVLVPSRPTSTKKWACIVRCGGIGDNLVAASVLPGLKTQGYMVEVISQAPQAALFENNPNVDKLSVLKKGDLPEDLRKWGEYFRLRAKEYAKFVNLSHSMEGMLAMFDGSMAWDWSAAYRRKMCAASYLETAHDVVGVPYEFGNPLFFPTDEEREQAASTIRKISRRGELKVVGWCLAGSRLDKLYPQTPILIARLIKELGVAVVMFGAPDRIDFEMAKQVQDHCKEANSTDFNLHLALSPQGTDTWPARRALTTAAACDLIITPDTGLGWGVAMEAVPKIMLHSHASQRNITSHWRNTISMIPASHVKCWPCHKLHNVKDTCEEEQLACGMTINPDAKGAACISSIPVEDILVASRKMLIMEKTT